MKLYQLANDPETYGHKAGWWLVVTNDLLEELTAPFPTQEQAERAREALRAASAAKFPTFQPDRFEALRVYAWALLIVSILLGMVAIHGN